MNAQSTSTVSVWRLGLLALGFALVGGIVGWFWQAHHAPIGNRAAIEQVIHDYVLANPEILPQAMENLRKREDAKQLSGVSGDLKRPFPGAVLGNPAGKVTLVEFSDFACTFCRQSEAEVASLIQSNPDLKVVIRQLPILSPASADAARMGLAAARQGRYAAYHHAMYAGGRPDATTIEAAARSAGLDMARAQKDIADPALSAEIDSNMEFARKLGFQGTPSWVIGEEIHAGAVGHDVLAAAIVKARG
ncbi:MAG: DsbA family protein [Novosphingobium sp.]